MRKPYSPPRLTYLGNIRDLMSTEANNRETLAIRAALKAFAETLDRELGVLDGATLAKLDGTRHAHVSLLCATVGRAMVVATVVQFNSDPAAVQAALGFARKGPAS